MNRTEFEQVWDEEILKRWPKWNPAETDMKDWYYALGFADATNLTNAVRDYKVKDSAHTPKINRIKEILIAHYPTQRNANRVWTEVFVECVECPVANRVGLRIGIYNLEFQDNHDYMMRAAEVERKKCERIYGGKWIVIQDYEHRPISLEIPNWSIQEREARRKEAYNIIRHGGNMRRRRTLAMMSKEYREMDTEIAAEFAIAEPGGFLEGLIQ